MNSGHLSKFSLIATQAVLYFDAFAPGDTVKVKFRLRAKYPIRVRTFQLRVYEYYDPEVASAARPVVLEMHRQLPARADRTQSRNGLEVNWIGTDKSASVE